MKKFTYLFIVTLMLLAFAEINAQTVSLTAPALSTSTILVNSTVSATATRSANGTWPGGNGSFVYTWSSTGPAVVSFTSNPNTTSGTTSTTTASGFTTVGTYTIKCTVQEQGGGSTVISSSKIVNVLAAAPTVANLWATSTDGNRVSSFVVSNGTYFSGPTNIFDPFPSSNQTTAALGMTAGPGGNFYWLPNDGTNGVVNVYASTLVGGSIVLIGSLDVNGASNNTLGFVRLGMDALGNGWILAGDGTTLYLAKFVSNGVLPVTITIEDASVSLVGGAVSTFQNGDLCVSGNGTIYALANDGGGVTQIFKGVPSGATTTLTKSHDLVDNTNAAFSGRVNGVAFDLVGSIYLSTDNGLYYVDAATVNGPAGTVGCFLVRSQTGLQDLASNIFPSNSLLPVKLISFTGTLNGNTTNLNWVTENIQNFSHFEVERSTDGINFNSIVSKNATGDLSSRATYLYGDNMSSFGVNYAVYYRLKMIDLDGKFSYSNVILVRKDGKAISDIKVIPNPLIRGSIATISFEATERATVNLNVLDMSGRTVLRQQNNVEQGTNSIPLNNFTTLQPGTYILQMNDGVNIQTTKFIIAK